MGRSIGVRSTVAARRIRWGILCLPLAGLVGLQSLVITGDEILPSDGLRAFAEQAVSSRYQIALLLTHLSLALTLVGAVALYAYLFHTRAERWALAGFVSLSVSIIAGGVDLGIGLAWIAEAQAYLEGQRGALGGAIRLDNLTGVPLLLKGWGLVTGFLAQILGNLFFGVAIWRSGTLPQGAAVLWVGASLLGAASLNPSTYLGAGIVALVTALDLGGSGWIAWSIWQRPIAKTPSP
jgi:hypothetical protein